MSNQLPEPAGISFYSIRTGETHHGKLEPTIAAYINSSDMGINASRGQDFGWRLDPTWVKRVREFKKDALQMSILTQRNEGQKPTTVNILYYLYGQELAAYFESMEENENPFEEEYARAIAAGKSVPEAAVVSGMPQALADFQAPLDDDDEGADLTDLIDDAIEESEEKPVTGIDPAKPGEDKTVETTVKNPVGRPPKPTQK